MGHKQEKRVLHCDSQSAIHLARNPGFHARTKLIQVRYHFFISVLEDGVLVLKKIQGSKNPMDMLTMFSFSWLASIEGNRRVAALIKCEEKLKLVFKWEIVSSGKNSRAPYEFVSLILGHVFLSCDKMEKIEVTG